MATEVGIDAGKRRRLPSWMQGIATADHGCKLRNDDEENVLSEVANSSSAPKVVNSSSASQPKRKSRAKRLQNEAQLCDKELTEVDSSLLVKCAKRSGKTKLSQRDVDGDSATHTEDEVLKKRTKRTCHTQRAAEESAPQKKRRGKDYRAERSTDTMATAPSEDDGELTMEDLISIAEEYVSADNEIKHQSSGRGDSTSVTHALPANCSSIESESGGSLKDTLSIRESSTHLTESSISNLRNTGSKDQDDSIGRCIIAERSLTGDPTQDMLDLFLGPLLKKSQKEEKTKEITTQQILDYEFMKHDQSQSVETEVVPLVKKKSSLKDKVSMFLD